MSLTVGLFSSAVDDMRATLRTDFDLRTVLGLSISGWGERPYKVQRDNIPCNPYRYVKPGIKNQILFPCI